MDIKAFMKPTEEEKKIKLERFDEPFVIRTISEDENEAIRRANTHQVPNKNGVKTPELDTTKYQAELVAKAVISPDLSNADLQEYYGTQGSNADTLKAMLRTGEYMNLSSEVMDFSGFSESIETLKDEIKN